MITVIFSGGIYRDIEFYRDVAYGADLVIAADSGGSALLALGKTPHLLVGDMDSILPEVRDALSRQGAQVIEVPPEKDVTDTQLAVTMAIERGATRIVICGALGGRLDHTLANVSLLIHAQDSGVPALIVNEDQEASLLIPNVKNRIAGSIGDTVSLISLSDLTTGVTTYDLKYPLSRATLPLFTPLGVSNIISGPQPRVEYESGRLLLVRVRNP